MVITRYVVLLEKSPSSRSTLASGGGGGGVCGWSKHLRSGLMRDQCRAPHPRANDIQVKLPSQLGLFLDVRDTSLRIPQHRKGIGFTSTHVDIPFYQ